MGEDRRIQLPLTSGGYPKCNRWDSGLPKLTSRVGGWVGGGWPIIAGNNTTSWLHLASCGTKNDLRLDCKAILG